MANVAEMSWSKIYSALLTKAERKGRTEDEVNQLITWLTGYEGDALQKTISSGMSYYEFYDKAPRNPHSLSPTSFYEGVRLELRKRQGCR